MLLAFLAVKLPILGDIGMSVIEMIVPMLFDLVVLSEVLTERGMVTREQAERMRVDAETLGRSGASDLRISTNQGYDIGLSRNDKGAYEVAAHWTQQPGRTRIQELREDIENTIRQKYAYEKVRRELAKKGFTISEEEVRADNTIKLVVRKW